MADSNIFAQYLRPVRSVAEYTADYDRQEANALELVAGRRKRRLDDQADADDQFMRQAYQESAGDPTRYRNELERAGLYRAVRDLDDAELKRTQLKAETGLKTAQADKARQDASAGAQKQRYDAAMQHAQDLAYVNTPQDAVAYIQRGIEKGVYPQMTPEQIQQQLAQFPSIEAYKQRALQASIPVLDRMRIEAENERNRLTNQTSRDNNTATNATSRANNQATVGATIRGQNLTDARSRDSIQQGKIPPGYRQLPDGNLQAIPGGPADVKAGAVAAAKTGDAKDVLTLLDEVDSILPKATGSGVDAAYDSALGAVGRSTQGAEAADQLKVLQGALISKMPKMSGPQSDKDVQLYREMAGQVGDPSVPIARRQAASRTIRRLNEKYAGVPAGSSKPGADIRSQADAILGGN